MVAFAKLMVLIAIFLLASYANTFPSLRLAAVNQVRVNYLIQLEGPRANKQNE